MGCRDRDAPLGARRDRGLARELSGNLFAAGDPCLLIDGKGRTYLIELVVGREFQYHRGVVAHDAIIGSAEGSVFESSLGNRLTALRPRLKDYALKMGRGATVVYPKDAAAMVMWADVAPGHTVLEAGTGSGALAMVLVRAVGADGLVVSVERRADHAELAASRIAGFFGRVPPQLDLRIGSVEDAVADVKPDRIVLDVPEPWHAVAPATEHLSGGGVFCCYLPTVPQVQEVRAALSATRRFIEVETFEVLHRGWVFEGRSVRPEHRMQGHTGFITVGRLVATDV